MIYNIESKHLYKSSIYRLTMQTIKQSYTYTFFPRKWYFKETYPIWDCLMCRSMSSFVALVTLHVFQVHLNLEACKKTNKNRKLLCYCQQPELFQHKSNSRPSYYFFFQINSAMCNIQHVFCCFRFCLCTKI